MTAAGPLLVAGIVCASLAEAIAGTALALARFQVGGDVHATPDEMAWLEIAYIALKLTGFMFAPWLLARVRPHRVLVVATLALGAACGLAALSARLDVLLGLRALQGFAGGILLVAGQAILFFAFARRHQPVLQALFALGCVVAPATLTPALGGWLLDHLAWAWIFFSVAPLALAAAGLVLLAGGAAPSAGERRPFDWIGFPLLAAALGCGTCVLSQGSRWNWFDEPRIVWLAAGAGAALLAFLGRQAVAGTKALVDTSVFRSDDFTFAALVSLVAGAALLGTAFLIPSFAVGRLAFTPTAAGLLLLPGSAPFAGALFLSAYLMQVRRMPPIATVPLGILLIMLAMGLLSRSTADSGAADMMAAVLLRASGLGFLFLSITMVAFGQLPHRSLAAGIGLFNMGRQIGGLMGVAALQTLIDHEAAANAAVLGANITAGSPPVAARLGATAALLAGQGLDAAAAGAAAASLLGRAVAGQSAVMAFGTAFLAVALLLLVAAPVLIGFKAGLRRRAQARAAADARDPQR